MTSSHESGPAGLPGEGDRGRQAPTAETLAALDELLERCGPPDTIEDERRAEVIVTPVAPEQAAVSRGAEEQYIQVTATLRTDARGVVAPKPSYGELVVTKVIPKLDDNPGILNDPVLYERLWSVYRDDAGHTNSAELAGYLVGQAGPNIEHNKISQKEMSFADGTRLSIFRCRPVSGPITWEPETAEMLHIEHLHPAGRTVAYVVKSDGARDLFVTEKAGRGVEITEEGLAMGQYRATEPGLRELMVAIETSLASGSAGNS